MVNLNTFSPLTIAVVGDIHEQWDNSDHRALKALAVDLVLFVGDLGNESLAVVAAIADLDLPKAIILGNHDAWYTASDWGRKKAPYDHQKEDRVKAQLEMLGNSHVGYGKLDFPQFDLAIIGSRPFTWGGVDWKNKTFLQERYGVANFQESIAKIQANIQSSQQNTLIFLGHNGPTGLGDYPEAICGRDWQPLGGDHGDPDFGEVIYQAQNNGKTIPLVTFGHMHHRLRHRQDRLRTRVVVDAHGTVYLNGACVPRIITTEKINLRHFSLVQLMQKQVSTISSVWVDVEGQIVMKESLYDKISS